MLGLKITANDLTKIKPSDSRCFYFLSETERRIRANDPAFNSRFNYAVSSFLFFPLLELSNSWVWFLFWPSFFRSFYSDRTITSKRPSTMFSPLFLKTSLSNFKDSPIFISSAYSYFRSVPRHSSSHLT